MSKTQRPPAVYRHETSTRLNQPTAEMANMLDDDIKEPKSFTVQPRSDLINDDTATTDRKQEIRPRLAWDRQGRTSSNTGQDWEFQGSPLYTREKVNPLTMIEQLRKPDAAVPLNLLDDFNGLPTDHAKWEFYQHSGHWQNRLIHGDSSRVMQSLIAQEDYTGKVQMIYFDPPYGIGYRSNFMSSTHRTDANDLPAGDTVPLQAFRDTYKNGIHSYLDEVHERLVLFKELLADTGSLFVQIGDENVHLMAVACDEVFGAENRVATITWKPTSGSSSKKMPESSSYLLWYGKHVAETKYFQIYEALDRQRKISLMSFYGMVELSDGTKRKLTETEKTDPSTLPLNSRLYRRENLTSMGYSKTRTCGYEHEDIVYHPGRTRQWCVSVPTEHTRTNENDVDTPMARESRKVSKLRGLDRLKELNRLDGTGENGTLHWKQYEEEIPGKRIDNVWASQSRPNQKRYTVQTANSIIERCILMSTDPGDLVLDPTCGSGVTAHMAERWGRRWVTIDASRVAVAIARRHLLTATHPWYRTVDDTSDPGAGFVYETFQRVSAATLAYDTVNDPENTIPLVDRPEEDKKRKRLTGPFTVESHNPLVYVPISDHRATQSASSEQLGVADIAEQSTVLDALLGAPICDSDGHEVLRVDELQAWPETRTGIVSHEADCSSPGRETRTQAGIMVAASDVTVTNTQTSVAAKECADAGFGHLIVVASAFEDNISKHFGRVTAHRVLTSRDLQIPGLKQVSDAGTFTLLADPDVNCTQLADGMLQVEVLGYDTFDPSTGELKSAHGQDVDCWMIDTNHDGMAFFPRLTYLPAYDRNDPHIKNLVKTLGRDLDPEAHKLLCGLKSQPFPPPDEDKTVAVKIITRTGAEMTATV